MAHAPGSLRRRLGGGNPAPATGGGRRQAQGNNCYRVPFGKLRMRAFNGPEQEVHFPQEYPPGSEAQLDLTHCNSLGVTIGGRRYRHLLFRMVLSHSGWRHAEVVAVETFLALKQGLQNALWELGGAPQVIRSANTSALTHEIERSRGRDLNDNYAELLDHYGLESTLINSGESH